MQKSKNLGITFFFAALMACAAAVPGRVQLPGHVPAVVARLTPIGQLPATNQLHLAIGLPLRDPAGLDALLAQLYDPASTNYHQFLTPPELAARFGPTAQDYAAVRQFAESNGLAVVREYPNRMVLDVEGSVADIGRAFQVTLRTYRHPAEPRDFFAPDTEPSVPSDLKVISIEGLNNFSLPRPAGLKVNALTGRPLSFSGSGPNHEYMGNDFRNAYVPGATNLNGAGQTVALLEYSDYYKVDVTNYENAVGAQMGATNYVPLKNVIVGHRTPGTANNDEVALDIEMAIAMAPKLAQVIVYEESSANSSVLSQIQSDNLAKQVSSSWMIGPWSSSTAATWDNILMLMAAQGQSYFQSSGDSDAYTGAQPLDSGTTVPADSPYATIVGGTSLTMNGSGASWSSETVWNYNLNSIPNEGSGGGISTYYSIPSWQTNISMASNGGSTSQRNIPDVALTADNIYVCYNNGDTGGSSYFMGTSAAAPLWAGFMALVNQQAALGGTTNGLGLVNPALYAIATNANDSACFHDIVTGNNIGTNTPGLYNAVAGYDLCTGLGTPNGTNLINALAPPAFPYFTGQPASQIVTNGANVSFNASAGGQPPLKYQWQFNGTNLPAGGNISGVTSNTLTLTAVTSANAGNYTVVITNSYGAITSSVATLTVIFPPSFTSQPTNQSVIAGNNAIFSATVTGAPPLVYQWKNNGTNVLNGGNISGATTNMLTLASVSAANAGNYTLVVTNIYGSATSSVVALTVLSPAAITSSSFTNRIVQCGQNTNTFAITVTGTPPLNIQWSLNAAPVAGATNTSFSLTNLDVSADTVSVTVTNLYGSATSNAALTVVDTLAPVITLNSTNPFYVELGDAFTDPGATAYDTCAGVVPVTASGAVNTAVVSTNTLTYTATDGNGNTNTATRTVIVRDTTPPTILWSYTNLVLAANSNCVAIMPDATGTNFIRATDSSGSVTITQDPTNNAALPIGTNVVILTAADASGNQAYSTNQIVVQDETPPVIFGQPQSLTNSAGTTASFGAAAVACTPLSWRWFFNGAALAAQTNSTLTLTNVSAADAGNYSVVVTADGGSSTSDVAALTVNLLAAPVALASSENPSGFKDNVNFTAGVTPASATGTIQWLTNGTEFAVEPLTNGIAAGTNLAMLPRGTNFVTAIYSGDAWYLPGTNSLAQIVTNHPPVAAPAFYTNALNSPLNIAIADLTMNWSDVDGDTVSLAAAGVSTNGIVVTNTGTALVYFNSNNVPDEFTCTITDGWGGTNFQLVSILPAPTPSTTPLITGVVLAGNGSVTLDLGGAPDYTYILETATNLAFAAWSPVATNTLGTNGVWQFNDAQATNFDRRFYRLKLAQ